MLTINMGHLLTVHTTIYKHFLSYIYLLVSAVINDNQRRWSGAGVQYLYTNTVQKYMTYVLQDYYAYMHSVINNTFTLYSLIVVMMM